MELLFEQLVSDILEDNLEKGYERNGQSGLKMYQKRDGYEIPKFEDYNLTSKFSIIETFNHGTGVSIELEVGVSDNNSESLDAGVSIVALNILDTNNDVSLMTSGALGWAPWELSSNQKEISKTETATKKFNGQIPLSFLSENKNVNFQIKIESVVGNINIQYFCLCLGDDEKFNKLLDEIYDKKKKDNSTIKKNDFWDYEKTIPPPTIHGEEIELDMKLPPVYSVSDFHIGSNMHGKVNSNDMDYKTLERFMQWLRAIDKDAKNFDHYDVVMNGDFLDLWQAKRSKDDNYGNRLKDIIDSNTGFFDALGRFLRGNQRCRFYYVIGNHDDPLSYDTNEDDLFGPNESPSSLKYMIRRELRTKYERRIVGKLGRVRHGTITADLLPFNIQDRYTNSRYRLHMHHGHHEVDDVNQRDDDGERSGGQHVSEQVNKMQENYGVFKDIEFTPNNATAQYLNCLWKNPNSGKTIKDEIEELKKRLINATAGSAIFGNIYDIFTSDKEITRTILEKSSSKVLKKDSAKGAWEIVNDQSRSPRVKIVSFGHTHLEDIVPESGESPFALTNTGSWLKNIKFSNRNGCKLQVLPSNFPYVKISKEKGANKALVELKFFNGNEDHKLVKVDLS